jgi:hypothetical protein
MEQKNKRFSGKQKFRTVYNILNYNKYSNPFNIIFRTAILALKSLGLFKYSIHNMLCNRNDIEVVWSGH